MTDEPEWIYPPEMWLLPVNAHTYGDHMTASRVKYIRADLFPALGASAMQRAAESIARPNHNGKPTCACASCNQRRWVADMISNLPLPDHAALLAEALRLPKVKALVEALNAANDGNFSSDCGCDDCDKTRERIDTALAALKGQP